MLLRLFGFSTFFISFSEKEHEKKEHLSVIVIFFTTNFHAPDLGLIRFNNQVIS